MFLYSLVKFYSSVRSKLRVQKMEMPYTSKKGQIYIITAIIICIGLLALFLTQRTSPEQNYSFASSFQTIERELPRALVASQSFSDGLEAVARSFDDYFSSQGIQSSFIILRYSQDQVTLYSDFSSAMTFSCNQTSNDYQLEPGVTEQIASEEFFTLSIDGTTMLVSQMNCSLTVRSPERRTYSYPLVINRFDSPSYTAVVSLEKDDERTIRVIEG